MDQQICLPIWILDRPIATGREVRSGRKADLLATD
jgi:hypothetical protein